MLNRPQPTFNSQCPISCIAVLEKKDLIATINYANELEIRRISNQKILYQKSCFYANKMHFWGEYLLMYDHNSFTLLDWQKDAIIKKENSCVFSNLNYYLAYQEGAFKLKLLLNDIVLWENFQEEADCFIAKMAGDFLFIKTCKNGAWGLQLWDIKQNKEISLEYYIKKETQQKFDFEQFKEGDSLRYFSFLNEGKNLLIEQFKDDCWRVIVFCLETLEVIADEVLDHSIYLARLGFTEIFCYKDSFYYLSKNNELRKFSLSQKHHFSKTINFEKSKQFSDFFFDEFSGIMYFLGNKNEIVSLHLDSGLQYLINFDLPFRIDESTLFTNFIMCTSSFSGGLIKVDLKTNERKIICYALDEVHSSQVLNNKIINLSNDNFVEIWDLNTNKILKRKTFKIKKYSRLSLEEKLPSYSTFRFKLANYSDKSIKQFDYDEELNLVSTKDFPNYEISREYSLECDNSLITIHNENKTITFCSSTTHWRVEAPDFFDSKGIINACQLTHNECGYIAKDSIYKVNLTNGEIKKGITFRKHDIATAMQISNDFLFVGMEGFCIFIIDLKTFKLLHKISTDHESAHSLLFCPNRNFLFVASSYCSEITIYDVLSGKEVLSWQAHKSNLSKLFYLEDQNALLSVCNNGAMRKWDYNTFELLDEHYSLPDMPDKKYRKGWAHIDAGGKLRGSIHHKKYFEI